jgi:hypothetical protein
MHDIPGWSLRVVSSASGIVVAESFDGRIPDGSELLYEQGLAQGYPYVINDQIAAGEVRELQILRLGNGLSMLVQSSEQYRTGGNVQAASPAGAGGYGLTDVDRSLEASVAVALDNGLVWWEIFLVVDGMDAGAI